MNMQELVLGKKNQPMTETSADNISVLKIQI